VTFRIDALLDAGYLVEDGSIVDGRGRPSTRLRVNDHLTTILVADLGATHGRLAVGTPAGDVLVESVIESNISKGPEAALAMVTRKLDQLLNRSGRTRSSLRGAAIGVPGPVNRHTGRIARSISMPGWDNYSVQDHLNDYFGVPAVVDNDANLMGLGEQRRVYPDTHQVLFIKVGTGIGASVIIDGELLRGTDSAEGDIGHAKITGSKKRAAVVAPAAVSRPSQADARWCGICVVSARAVHLGDVVQLVRAGNPDAVRIVTAAGLALGDVLSTAVSLLNPDVVVIGGDVVHAHERFMLGVRDTLLARSQPLATARLTIAPSALGDRAGITGAAATVADVIFGSAAVDARIT
jgi:predicted NBD/HSP70 family sugar kinase